MDEGAGVRFETEQTNLMKRIVDALERQATVEEAMLKLAQEPPEATLERGPSQCPYCGQMPLEIWQKQAEGVGPLDDVILIGETNCCHRWIGGMPLGWNLFSSGAALESAVEEGRIANVDSR